MRSLILALAALCLAVNLLIPPVAAHAGEPAPTPATVHDILFTVTADDGTPLETKLSLPSGTKSPVPVVFYLHGAGPATYDKLFGYRDSEGRTQVGRYLDFHSAQLAQRGIGFFRMCKRGCTQLTNDSPRMRVSRSVFSAATPSVLLADYVKGLEALRERPEIDKTRIVLMGSSEGTRLAPRLARQSPSGVIAVVMIAYAEDNTRDTVIWQNSVGPWRNIQHLFPAARDGKLTRAEFDAAVAQDPSIETLFSFATFDRNGDGEIAPDEPELAVKPRLDAILKWVDERDDDSLARAVVGLSSAYLLEDWRAEPNHKHLLALDIPLAIFHGELDGTTRVEGVREAETALRAAGRTNLTVRFYPDGNHDLNWTWQSARKNALPAFDDVFNYIAHLQSPRRTE